MKAIALITTAVLLSSCTVNWTLSPDGSESFSATIIPIPVVEDGEK